MSWLETSAFAVSVLAGLFLVALGSASLLAPPWASRFLLGFASTRSAHLVELLARFAAGAGFIIYAPRMLQSRAFHLFGWVLIVTTACLAILPWQWHRRFAQQAVPLFTRYLAVLGAVSLILGACVLGAVAGGR